MIALRAGLTTALVLFGATGCSEPIDDPSQNPPLKELGCNPGERLLEDESCRSAGVPAEGCGSGFVADGQGGCDPILPLMDCPAGEIAVPGDSTCREIMACGSGTYGDIPVDATTHYVDDSYGGMSDGSASQPWTTIQEALAAAPPGTLVAVAAGSYGGSLDITKPVRLWGRCPAQVEVVGTDQEAALVTGAGSGSELRGVSLRGSSVGVFVNGATGVLLDSVRIHDVTLRGVNVQSAGPSLTLRGSVVEDAGQVSVVVLGGDALIEGTMMRTRPGGPATGQGLAVQKGDAGSSAIVRVERVLIDGTGTCGMRVSGASLDVEGTVVRRGRPGQDGSFGSGVLASPEFDGTRAQLTVRRSVIEDNHHSGIGVAGSDALIEATVVRRTLEASNMLFGRGITGEHEPISGHTASVTVIDSLVSDNAEIGIAQVAGQLAVEGTIVRGTRPRALDQLFGRGISVEDHGAPDLAGSLSVYASVVESNHEIGIGVAGSTATVDHTLVRGTRTRPDGQFGDGITVLFPGGAQTTWAEISDCRIEGAPRAGVASFGALVGIGSTMLVCNLIHLDGESHAGTTYTFDNRGANSCGCDSAAEECKTLSSSLEAPAPVSPP